MHWLKWLWTFPLSAWGSWNRKERLLDFVPSQPDQRPRYSMPHSRQVWIRRVWFRGFAHAAWPYILVPKRYNRESIKLMHHEDRHLQQQMRVGGILFLVSYLLFWLVLFIFTGANVKKAHKLNPWERDARSYAEDRMKEMEK